MIIIRIARVLIDCSRDEIMTTSLQIKPERGGNPINDKSNIPNIDPSAVEWDRNPPNSIILFFFRLDKVNKRDDADKQYTIR